MMKKLWFISLILLGVAGCSEEFKVSTYHVDNDQQEIETLTKVFKDNQNLSEAAAVFFDHQLVVSVQVQQMSKFKKEKIKKSIEKKVKSAFPDHDVYVSSDLKITWELKKIINAQPNTDELKKDLKEVKALAKEET